MLKVILSLLLGILLIVSGTALLTYQGITVTTAERQLLHVGPLQAATEQSHWTITLPPILGAALLGGKPPKTEAEVKPPRELKRTA